MKSFIHPKSFRSLWWSVCLLPGLCLGLPASAQTNYRILHHFTISPNDGATPWGPLIQSGSMLYGMTSGGGSNSLGTVFRINTDGTDFQLLHSFVSTDNDGAGPEGALLLSGSLLYGMATSWNANDGGTLFRLNTDGTGFRVLHRFNGADGRHPGGDLLLADPQFRVVPLNLNFAVAGNDNWGGTAELQAAFAQTYAFALPTDSRDAAAVVRLPPGGYTVQATGVGDTTGNVLVEVYDMDP